MRSTRTSSDAPGAGAPGSPPVSARGFTLIEIAIVIAVMGVLLGAVLLLFQAGSRSADMAGESAEASMDARTALDALETCLQTAGSRDGAPAAHPVTEASVGRIVFHGRSGRGDACEIVIEPRPGGGFTIREGQAASFESAAGLLLEFAYFDGTGGRLSEEDLSSASGCDMIRRIDFRIETAGGAGALSGSASPPNLSL
ncbi:MAG: type II secretion system protein [Candidatus Fermentibacter sp.]|nr:type II secretion system protein [Candidatus Fermentibacter sp.]